jgi:GT2 family glycosyltransferase
MSALISWKTSDIMNEVNRLSHSNDIILEDDESLTKFHLSDIRELPFVSVIVPVYRDWDRLNKCVEALERQTYSSDRYEIIIVNNECETHHPSVVSRKQVKLVNEQKRGSYAARNRGLSISKGDIICFTDSDCIPNCGWIEEGVKYLLSNPNIGAVGGSVELFFKNPDKKTSIELYDLVHAFQQKMYIEERSFAATANLFAPKASFEILGGFNEELMSSGDREWGERLGKQGMKMAYCPTATVRHPARHSIKELMKKVARLTGGQYDLASYSGTKGCLSYLRKLALLFVPPLRRTTRLLFDGNSELNTLEKIKYILVSWTVHYTRAFEYLRLGLGRDKRR